MLSLAHSVLAQTSNGTSAALLTQIIFPLPMVWFVYKRGAEKGRKEKQNTHSGLRRLSPVSAGHCPLIVFWEGSIKNVNHVWLSAMGLEENYDRAQHCGAAVCSEALENSLQLQQFIPEKDPSDNQSDWHWCSGSASSGVSAKATAAAAAKLAPRALFWWNSDQICAPVEKTMQMWQMWPTCFPGGKCTTLQSSEELNTGNEQRHLT